MPQVYSAQRFKINLTPYPDLENELSAFIRAHAHRQPDTPDDLRIQ